MCEDPINPTFKAEDYLNPPLIIGTDLELLAPVETTKDGYQYPVRPLTTRARKILKSMQRELTIRDIEFPNVLNKQQ